MAVITISRQMGSMGEEVALALQKKLNYQIVNREIINQAAQRARKPEIALATIDDLGLFGFQPDVKDRLAYNQAVSEIMEEVARRGNTIIIGRAGQIILKQHAGVFHTMVIAPTRIRAERISKARGISINGALAQIQASDDSRRRYLKRNYDVDWDDPELYDLILNTGRISPEQAAGLICQALERLEMIAS